MFELGSMARVMWSTRPLEARTESSTEAARLCLTLAFPGLGVSGGWPRGVSRCLETANTGTLGDNSESIPNLVRYQPESVLYSKIYSSLAASRHLEAYQIGGFELSWPCKLSVSSGLEVMVSKQSRKAARPRGSHWAQVYARALIHIAKNSHLDILFIF
jgi:hypothetical protein